MKIPTREQKIKMLENGIIWAMKDFKAHIEPDFQWDLRDIDDFSVFAHKLAEDSYESKATLRDLFRRSPAWDEELDALVVNGNRTHEPDKNTVRIYLYKIMTLRDEGYRFYHHWKYTVDLIKFLCGNLTEDDERSLAEALNEIEKGIYAKGKKKSKILRALFKHFRVIDESAGSEYNQWFTKLADEVSSRKIDFKFIISLNPAHFITMSNANCDERGETLVSCHSLTSDYSHCRGGNVGYARDNVTMITFIPADPEDPETYNNRKIMRQLFMYGEDSLLQSRLYLTGGGVYGNADNETMKLYRDLVQREISFCEGKINLWKTEKYNNSDVYIPTGEGFAGYADWLHDFDCRVSIRKGRTEFAKYSVGTHGRCYCCGEVTDSNDALLCKECDDTGERCHLCGERLSYPCWAWRNGTRVPLCEECRNNNYYYCDCCGEWVDDATEIHDRWYCDGCRADRFSLCDCCGEWEDTDEMTRTVDGDLVCESCLDSYYTQCTVCGEWVHNRDTSEIYNGDGVCEFCRDDYYVECEKCGELYPKYMIREIDGRNVCTDCASDEELEEV